MLLLKRSSTLVSYVGCLAIFLPLSVSVQATTLTAVITSDEDYKAYVSVSDITTGTLLTESAGVYQDPETANVELTPGVVNYLHIEVSHGAGLPSMLIGFFTLNDSNFVFPNGSQSITTNAVHWKVGREAFGYGYEPITDLGFNGANPWGSFMDIPISASFIWSDYTGDHYYFSLPILPASSATEYSITIEPDKNTLGSELIESGNFPLTSTFQDENMKILVSSDPGRLGAYADLSPDPTSSELGYWVGGKSEFWVSDFVISPPPGGPMLVTMSLNLVLKGTIKGGAGIPGVPGQNTSSQVSLGVDLQVGDMIAEDGGLFVKARHISTISPPITDVTIEETHYFEGVLPEIPSGDPGDFAAEFFYTIDTLLTVPEIVVEAGVPFTLHLRLSADTAIVESGAGADAVSSIDFSGGLSFPTSGDVFNLPEGYTINSASANIQNNRFEVEGSEPEETTPFVEGFYLNIPGIPGRSEAPGHEEWIEFESASAGVYKLDEVSAPIFGDIVIAKLLDKSSPLIAQSLVNGTVHEDVILNINKYISGSRASRFEYRLKEAVITEYQMRDKLFPNAENEVFTLNYSRVDWLHQTTSWTGKVFEEVRAWWDVGSSEGGSESIVSEGDPPGFNPVENQVTSPSTDNQLGLVVGDPDTDLTELIFDLITTRDDLIRDLLLTGTGANRQLSYTTSALHSGFASILVTVFDGIFERSISIPVLINVEMTPFEGYLSAYFSELELLNREISSPIQDPDKDGIATIIEFLLGTNPNEFNKASEALNVVHVVGEASCTLTLEFKKRLDDPNIQGFIWVSQNLQDWERMDSSNPLYEESGQQGQNPLFEDTTATITFPDVCKEPHFIRYQVQDVF